MVVVVEAAELGGERHPGCLVGAADQRGGLGELGGGWPIGQEVLELRHRGGVVVILILEDEPVEEVGLE